jgi:hypothetical protein
VAFDAEHRLVLGVVCGKRSATRILQLLQLVKAQLRQQRVPELITSDEFSAYATVLKLIWPKDRMTYATVCKQRENGRISSVRTAVVFGSKSAVAAALKRSRASSAVNTSFIERHNATDRHRNARKVRSTYRFSKDWLIHEAVSHFCYYSYNFCWCVRTLRQRIRPVLKTRRHRRDGKRKPATASGSRLPRYRPRTPAMAAGLTDHVWTLREWLWYPVPDGSS